MYSTKDITSKFFLPVLLSWTLLALQNFIVEKQSCLQNEPISDNQMGQLHGLLDSEKDLFLENEDDIVNENDDEDENSFSSLHLKFDDNGEQMSQQAIEKEKDIFGDPKDWSDLRIGPEFVCCYKDPSEPNHSVGMPFPFKNLKPWLKYKNSAIVNMHKTQPVPVTSINNDNFEAFQLSTESFHRHHPSRKIVVYDIQLPDGISEEYKNILTTGPNEHLFVYKKFDFRKYPSHISNSHSKTGSGGVKNFYEEARFYRSLIWAEALSAYGAIVWFENTMNWLRSIDHLVEDIQNSGKKSNKNQQDNFIQRNDRCFTTLSKQGEFSVAHAVHPITYNYLPSNITRHMNPKNMIKNLDAVLIYNNEQCKTSIMRWLILCVLNKECIEPFGSVYQCPIGTNIYQPHLCHKYDQAIVNMLLVNTFGLEDSQQKLYYVGDDSVLADHSLGVFHGKLQKSFNYDYLLSTVLKHFLDFQVVFFTIITGVLIFVKNKF